MSYEIVFGKTKEIERLLRDELGYEGRGIHDYVTAAGDALPSDVARACRKVATIRNKLAHRSGYAVEGEEMESFNQAASFAIENLQTIVDRKMAKSGPCESPSSSSSDSSGDQPSWKTVAKICGAVVGLALVAFMGGR